MNEDVRLNGRYSGLKSDTMAAGVDVTSLTQLVQGGVTFDHFDEKWQLSLNAGRLWDDADNSRNLAGIEAGYAFAKGAIISIGYWASDGDDFAAGRLHSDGVYLNIRMILNEHLLDRLAGFM